MLMQKINNLKGFTLIEVMIVIFILLILGVIAIPNFISIMDKRKANSEPVQITVQQEEKAATPSKQKKATEQKGEMNKL